MILIVGGTGNVGRELIRLLTEQGVAFRALVRDRARAVSVLGAATPLVEGDLARPESLERALDGVSRVFLLSNNGPEQVDLQGNLVRAAHYAGVAHLVKVSGFRPATDRSRLVGHWHVRTEAQIRDIGLPFTFLQPGIFAQNFLMLYADSIRRTGTIPTPTTGRIAFVDTRDIAAVAAAVLTQPGHEGQTYTLTGSHALTFDDAARIFSETIGRPVKHQAISYEEMAAGLVQAGLPTWLCDFIVALYRSFDDGSGADVTMDVERITGRPAREFSTFVRDHLSLFQSGA